MRSNSNRWTRWPSGSPSLGWPKYNLAEHHPAAVPRTNLVKNLCQLIVVQLRELPLEPSQLVLELIVGVVPRYNGDFDALNRVTRAGDLRCISRAKSRGAREREPCETLQHGALARGLIADDDELDRVSWCAGWGCRGLTWGRGMVEPTLSSRSLSILASTAWLPRPSGAMLMAGNRDECSQGNLGSLSKWEKETRCGEEREGGCLVRR